MTTVEDVLAVLVAVPAADEPVVQQMREVSSTHLASSLHSWLSRALTDDDCVILRRGMLQKEWGVAVDLEAPARCRVGFLLDVAMEGTIDEVARANSLDYSVVLESSGPQDWADPPLGSIIVDPASAAAILVEGSRPMFWGLRAANLGSEAPQRPTTSYYTYDQITQTKLSLKRSRDEFLASLALDEVTNYARQIDHLKNEKVSGTTVLLATTFLPPVTHSVSAVQRFYAKYGASNEMLDLVPKKLAAERSLWDRQVAAGQRFDLLDRHAVEEYMSSPEYYQMSLTRDELNEQVNNFERVLGHPNYEVCFSPEAVNLAFEVRGGSEVRLRSDRRNKGHPRPGRIESLTLEGDSFVESFEREFWALYRASEPEFRDKGLILEWLRGLSARYQGPGVVKVETKLKYDVFLCHNSQDKDQVRQLAIDLEGQGIKPWFDEWCLIPGRPWQRALEDQISSIDTSCVIVGDSGFGPWNSMELEAFLREFVKRGAAVIPVILASTQDKPELPIFLAGMHWVDFRRKTPDPMVQLIAGITGEMPPR